MAKTNSNTAGEDTNEQQDVQKVIPAPEPIKMVKFRNTSSHKMEIGFNKEFYSVHSGSEIEILAVQENNFMEAHGRSGNWSKIVD